MANELAEPRDQKEDDLAEELGRYAGKWVAVLESQQKVVGSGTDAYEAKVDAERNGYTDTSLFRVPAPGKYHVYSL